MLVLMSPSQRMVKSIHTEGFKVPIYDKTIIDSISQTQEWTFQERIDWVCIVLKVNLFSCYKPTIY
jgi:hypothetical protein